MIGIYNTGSDSGVVYSYDLLWNRDFAPLDSDVLILDRVTGDSYQYKKSVVRDKAIHFSHMEVTMTWGDVAEIQAWFEKFGRRYGLLREFRENGIC